MQFALVNNTRTPPSPGLKGSCPVCGGMVDARCGDQRIHHWAHRGKRTCDRWWESETPWHRGWKNLFPALWQEVIQHDLTGEKHIADVRTEHGLTIEFQHSHLRPEERSAREVFYGNMLWVVDGSRLIRDLPRFVEGFRGFRMIKQGWYLTPFPDEAFPKNWLDSTVPVFFDFGEAVGGSEQDVRLTDPLWCLLPGRASGQAVVIAFSKADFVRMAQSTAQPIQPQGILEYLARVLAEERRTAQNIDLLAAMALRQRQGWPRHRDWTRRTRF